MQTKTCSFRKSVQAFPTGQHADHCVNGMFTLASPQVSTSTVFICYIASVALIWPQITRKLIKNGGNRAERQNKQEIIYLNEVYQIVLG